MRYDHRTTELELGFDAGSRATPVPCRFGEFVLEWLEQMSIHWKRSHRLTVEGIVQKYLVPAFGELQLQAIDRRMVLNFRAWLSRKPGRYGKTTLSAQRINHVMTALRMVMDEASKQMGMANPCHGIRRLEVRKSDVQPFTFQEVYSILNSVRPDYRNYYRVRFFTGMRTGEIDGLQWRYVDFTSGHILVRETVVRGRIETPKTRRSNRDIDMAKPVRQALEKQHKVTGGRSDFVFTNRKFNPLNHTNVARRVWYPLLRKLKMELRKPYQTRHTAATLWLASGENPEWIARQLGHASTQMLFNIYARYVPNLTRRDGSAFEALLAKQGLSEG